LALLLAVIALLVIDARQSDKLQSSEVKPAIEAPAIHDISPPMDIPRSKAVWCGLAVGMAILGAAGVIVCKGGRHGQEAGIALLCPHEAALAALEELRESTWNREWEIKCFYDQMLGVLRQYMLDQFGLGTPEQTTREFLEAVNVGNKLAPEQAQELKLFLLGCDLVRFGDHSPSHEEIRAAFERCRAIVTETAYGV
jgi:hypothetical protein